jgi:acetyl esterase/lipase
VSTIAAILLLVLGVAAAAGVVNALWPRRVWFALVPSWAAGWLTIELAPHLVVLSAAAAAVLVALGAVRHATGWVGLAMLVGGELALMPMIWRSRRTVVTLGSVLQELELEDEAPRYPRSQIVLPFLMFRRRGVRHERGVEYARAGRRKLKLDVYLPEDPAGSPRPAIVQVHGGGWVVGSRTEQGIPLLNHLAANGWVGFNIDYRLSPWATFPDHLVDVKRAIAWVRAHAGEYGADPAFVAITGGSAGGHLAALAALTADDSTLQPGFEDADTSVAAAVPFYGVYDLVDEDGLHAPATFSWVLEPLVFKARRRHDVEPFRAASPIYRIHPDAPPFFVIHGERDSLVPVEEARRFVAKLREVSRNLVLYAEMKGGQHAFDLIPSWRTVPVVEAVERFLSAVHRTRSRSEKATRRDVEGALTD